MELFLNVRIFACCGMICKHKAHLCVRMIIYNLAILLQSERRCRHHVMLQADQIEEQKKDDIVVLDLPGQVRAMANLP